MSMENNGSRAKLEVVVRIIDADGTVIEKKETRENAFQGIEDFDRSTREGFLTDFDEMERAVLEVRDTATQGAIEGFLSGKKKRNSPNRAKADHELTANSEE